MSQHSPSNECPKKTFGRGVVKGDGTGFRLCHFFIDDLKASFQGPKRGWNQVAIIATSVAMMTVCNPVALPMPASSPGPDRNLFRVALSGT